MACAPSAPAQSSQNEALRLSRRWDRQREIASGFAAQHGGRQPCCGESAAGIEESTEMATSDFDEFVEQYHRALDEFFGGNPEPAKMLYTHREDASLANPFGPITTGWKQVAETMDRAASNYREGQATGFERAAKYVTDDLAYILEVERSKPRSAAAKRPPQALCGSRA